VLCRISGLPPFANGRMEKRLDSRNRAIPLIDPISQNQPAARARFSVLNDRNEKNDLFSNQGMNPLPIREKRYLNGCEKSSRRSLRRLFILQDEFL
jgi:hypothetical protein